MYQSFHPLDITELTEQSLAYQHLTYLGCCKLGYIFVVKLAIIQYFVGVYRFNVAIYNQTAQSIFLETMKKKIFFFPNRKQLIDTLNRIVKSIHLLAVPIKFFSRWHSCNLFATVLPLESCGCTQDISVYPNVILVRSVIFSTYNSFEKYEN